MGQTLNILIVDDEPGIRRSLGDSLAEEGYGVLLAERGEEALGLIEQSEAEAIHLMLLDVWMPGMDGLETLRRAKALRPDLPVVMISGHGNIETALSATRHGAYDFLEKPVDLDRLLIVLGHALRQCHLEKENLRLKKVVEQERFFQAESPAMKRLMADVSLVAPTEGRVLLLGENGSGKEEVARLIHAQSLRAKGPFVEVNCAAIPEELIESELFGHVKGAFTGAIRDQKGKFREADRGTLFLDEVGDMSLKTQAKVLRALQEGRIEPVGGGGSIGVDVRVVAATNKDLSEEIRLGRFREDLYFRLAVVPLNVPSLRERGEELISLAENFLSRLSRAYGRLPKRLSQDAQEALLRYDWPGNVRELKNLMERSLILSRGKEITERDLGPLALRILPDSAGTAIPEFPSLKEAREWFESIYIQREMKAQGGNMTRVAEKLGFDRSSLYKRLKALGIEP